MAEAAATRRVRIRGRVQGVGFRFWVVDEAERLGLHGWVRNRRDGSVEALFHGPADAVEEMVARCRLGPPAARVTAVETEEEVREIPGGGFRILPTV